MTDKKLDQTISDWLEAQAPMRVSDRVLSATFERTRKTRQQVGWRALPGRLSMPRFVTALASAAVVLVVVVVSVGIYFNGQGGFGGIPTASPSSGPTTSPLPSVVPSDAATSSPGDGSLPAGTHLLNPGREHGEDTITVTIPGPGWFEGPFTASLTKELGNENRVTLVVVSGDHYKVPRDICDWQTNPDLAGDRIADTLNQLVAFLMEQKYETPEGSITREFSRPVDITIDGYLGKSITSMVPFGGDRDQCDEDPSEGQFSQQRVFCSLQDRDSWACQLAHLEPGALDKLWIVDADQAWFRVIAASYPPTTSPDLLAEMNDIVESAVFTK